MAICMFTICNQTAVSNSCFRDVHIMLVKILILISSRPLKANENFSVENLTFGVQLAFHIVC